MTRGKPIFRLTSSLGLLSISSQLPFLCLPPLCSSTLSLSPSISLCRFWKAHRYSSRKHPELFASSLSRTPRQRSSPRIPLFLATRSRRSNPQSTTHAYALHRCSFAPLSHAISRSAAATAPMLAWALAILRSEVSLDFLLLYEKGYRL